MTDEKKLKNARNVFNTLCGMLDEKDFHYEIHEDDLVVTFGMQGENMPMQFVINIDDKRDLVRVLSLLPFEFAEDKRVDAAIATCQINYRLADGSFDFDCKTGRVIFRMTSSYKDSLISMEVFEYLIAVASFTIDQYSDKLLMLSKGTVTVEEFFKK
ncbi:MAG: YbjN domain-containing protein [Clostridia bacterium]|nr:YbjN domain-containing protein [Clostridia bacterium]